MVIKHNYVILPHGFDQFKPYIIIKLIAVVFTSYDVTNKSDNVVEKTKIVRRGVWRNTDVT